MKASKPYKLRNDSGKAVDVLFGPVHGSWGPSFLICQTKDGFEALDVAVLKSREWLPAEEASGHTALDECTYAYVWDIRARRVIGTSKPYSETIGYTTTQIEAMGSEAINHIVHRDDWLAVMQAQASYMAMGNRPIAMSYRLLCGDDVYRRLDSVNHVILRDHQGAPLLVLGLATIS